MNYHSIAEGVTPQKGAEAERQPRSEPSKSKYLTSPITTPSLPPFTGQSISVFYNPSKSPAQFPSMATWHPFSLENSQCLVMPVLLFFLPVSRIAATHFPCKSDANIIDFSLWEALGFHSFNSFWPYLAIRSNSFSMIIEAKYTQEVKWTSSVLHEKLSKS